MSITCSVRFFYQADLDYENELRRLFGDDAGAARSQERGKGRAGSHLRLLYDARLAAERACVGRLYREPKPRKPWKRQLKPRSPS